VNTAAVFNEKINESFGEVLSVFNTHKTAIFEAINELRCGTERPRQGFINQFFLV
jgi:hypothetical protein